MKKRSKMNRILSFVLSLSLIGNDILPAVAAGDGVPEEEIIAVSEDAVSDDEALSDGQTVEADTDPEEVPVEETAAGTEEPDVDAEDDEFVFVPGYIEEPGENIVNVVADGISYHDIESGLIDKDDQEYPDDLTAATESAFPYVYTDTGSISDYFSTTYPEPRNQNPYGSCWAHSAIGLAEFYMINHGMATRSVDYSELHLVNYTFVQGTPSIAGDTGDSVVYDPSKDSLNSGYPSSNESYRKCILNAGGNLKWAAQTLMRQRGVCLEEDVPYSDCKEVISNGIDPSLERKDAVYLKNAKSISYENPELIKECIVNNGIVGASIYADNAYYNNYYNSFYCAATKNTNHAVALVGWDDDFPATRFNNMAPGNGAWLVRNSWKSPYSELLSYYSYFWISYYDTSLTQPNGNQIKSAWTYEMMPVSEFPGNNYYYDSQIHGESIFRSTSPKYYSANIFTASSGAAKEKIESVGLELSVDSAEGVEYEIRIYTGVEEGKPSSGTLQSSATTTGTIWLSGQYTIQLKDPVIVNKGERFSVVVIRNDGCSVAVEYGGKMNNGVSWEVDAQSGQSFKSTNGSVWEDLGKSMGSNLVISAQTSDISDGITLSKSDISLTSTTPIAALAATVKDDDGNTVDDAVVTWTSSKPSVATVDKGVVTAVGDGTTTITATSGEHKAVCTVTVKLSRAAGPESNKETGSELTFGEKIELSCETPDAEIYYTLDGSEPSSSSVKYEDGISFGFEDAGEDIYLRAIAYAEYYNPSEVAEFEYKVEESKVGLNLSKKAVTLSSNEPEVAITAKVLKEDNSEDTDAVISWNIADRSVATIDKVSGNSVTVTAEAEGSTYITVTSGEYEEKCDVSVAFSEAAKPVSDKTEKELFVGDMISVSCATAGAKIYYTDDGTEPDTGSTLYTGKIKVTSDMVKDSSMVFKFRAFADHYRPSEILTYEFSAQSRAGIVLSETSLNLTSEKPEAVITATVYTDEGEEDKAAVVSYNSTDTKVVTVSEGKISAVGSGSANVIVKSGTLSANCSVSVNFTKLASPVADKADGSELKLGSEIVLSSTDSVAGIYYTLDGSEPDRNSFKYIEPIKIGPEYAASELVLKAVAIAEHYTDSDVASYTYTVEDRSAIELSDIKISFTEAGATKDIKATVYDAAGNISSNAAVVWSSSDEKVATVNNGSVTAVADGNAVITAVSGKLSAECTVTVFLGERKQAVPSSIIVVPESIEFAAAGESMQLKVVVEDQYGLVIEEPSLSYESNNKKVASVNESGLVSAVSVGKATITVKSGDAKGKCYVGVGVKSGSGDEERSAFDTVPDLSQDTLYLVAGQKFDLHYPSWNIVVNANKSVSISNKGILTAKKAGNAMIASSDGSMEYSVQVVKPVMSQKSATVKAGETLELSLSGTGDEYPVFWYSSAPSIATVEDGEVLGISKGSAKIIAVVNGKEYSCKVTVKDTVSVRFNASVKEITLSPLQSINTKIKGEWRSDSEMSVVYNGNKTAYADNIVYVTSSGKITAIGVGTTVLTAPNGTEYTVTVSDPVEQVQYIAAGKKKTLKFPSVKNTKAQWDVEDSNIAYVDAKGVVSTYSYTPGDTVVSCTYNPYGIEGAGFTYSAVICVENPAIDLPSEKANTYTLSAKAGDRIDLDFLSDDSHIVYQPVVFKSSKPAVAFVDENSVIRANDAGSAKLSAKINGKSISIKVTVTAAD